ncbi:hypothetical protein [Catenulispora pinisilvae]|uniref:hypothetical protein n=1 Tax=Catenulispora pinisilvae TaxID=2705253 RepID=UPI0018925839|nr:hypothetical protein [Catenulispora pinisilvae]
MVVVVDSWSVHPDFWECRPEVDYKRAYARARWLGSVLESLAGLPAAPEGLRLAVELYGPVWTVLDDGTAIAWIGADPDDAELWAELGPDEYVPLACGGLWAVA